MSFEAAYAAIRKAEGRDYTLEQVRKFPNIDPEHPLAQEWRFRKTSLVRLMGHLRSLDRPQRLLDLGCGIGWMSRHLSYLPGSTVLAVDRVASELAVAREAFGDRENIQFEEADIFEKDYKPFDTIVLGASAQYFPDLAVLLKRLLKLTRSKGQIHILDTPFYNSAGKKKAMKRTRDYYAQHGFPELAEHYFHHEKLILKQFQAKCLHEPKSLENRFRRKVLGIPEPPFPWYVIQKV